MQGSLGKQVLPYVWEEKANTDFIDWHFLPHHLKPEDPTKLCTLISDSLNDLVATWGTSTVLGPLQCSGYVKEILPQINKLWGSLLVLFLNINFFQKFDLIQLIPSPL